MNPFLKQDSRTGLIKRLKGIWDWASQLYADNVPQNEKRTVIKLNRINFLVITISLSGLLIIALFYWIFRNSLPQFGSTRFILISLSSLISYYYTSAGKYRTAKIITSTLPGFFLIVYPSLFGLVSIEHFFYYPFAGIGLAIIPIILFPFRAQRIMLVILVSYCFLLTVSADNILSLNSDTLKASAIFGDRYFFYKLSEILLFLFVALAVFSIHHLNVSFESLLMEKTKLLEAQKEELLVQSEEQIKLSSRLVKLNEEASKSNKELADYKRHLEELIESRTKALKESEEWFRNIFDYADDAIFLLKDVHFFRCNFKTSEIFRAEKEEIIGKTPYELSPLKQPDGRNSEEKAKEMIHAAIKNGSGRFEWQHKRFDGTVFDSEVSIKRIELTGQIYLLAIVRDITDRKKAEQKLADSETTFRDIFNKSKQGILIIDKEMRVLAANNVLLNLAGYRALNDLPIYATDFVLPGQLDKMKTRLGQLVKGETLLPDNYRARFSDGSLHIVETDSSTMEYFGKEAFLIMLRDVTLIKEHEQKVMEAMMDAEEKERSRIAQDLHDGLGPMLSAIQLYFQAYEDSNSPDKKFLLAEKLTRATQEAIEGISEIAYNLSPHVLRNYGICAALEQFVSKIELTDIVHIELHCNDTKSINLNTGIFLYRTITELINNSIKHSGCQNIRIDFISNSDNLQINYADDGKGFDIASAYGESSTGMGLQNIVNRIKALQGEIIFNSTEKKGMNVKINIST